jgi:hypothetical protein
MAKTVDNYRCRTHHVSYDQRRGRLDPGFAGEAGDAVEASRHGALAWHRRLADQGRRA